MLQPTVGHEIDTNENEQGGEQMPIPVCRDAQKGKKKQVGGAAGRTRGVPRTARASSKPAQVRDGAEAETGRERSSESVRQHFVLSARDTFFFLAFFLL